jgi:AraC-like DNA-binding protein
MSVAIVRLLAGRLTAAGVQPEAALAKLGIDCELLAQPDARIPTAAVFELFERVGELTGDPNFGLHAGASIPEGAMEVLDHATRASRTIGEGLERMARYYALLVERIETKIETVGDLARVIHRAEPPLVSPRHAVEMLFAAVVARGRAITRRDWPLRLVRFAHPRPADAGELERFFRAPIDFAQPIDEMVFDREFLDEPLVTANPSLTVVLDRYADTLLAELTPFDPFLAHARRSVAETLRGGAPSLEQTAKRLAMGARTLQRRLAAIGTSYGAIVDEVRRELATRYLAEGHIGLAEIAYLLGFSEGSAFHRAFRRWSGMTPKQYRDALGRAGAASI